MVLNRPCSAITFSGQKFVKKKHNQGRPRLIGGAHRGRQRRLPATAELDTFGQTVVACACNLAMHGRITLKATVVAALYATGALLSILIAIWAYSTAPEILSTPLGGLTLRDLIEWAGHAIIACTAAVIAFVVLLNLISRFNATYNRELNSWKRAIERKKRISVLQRIQR
jgi:hypothetical protein